MRRILARSCRAAALHGAAALTLAACAVGPDWSVPKSWSPDTWFASGAPHPAVPSEPAAAPIDAEWWKGFGDPVLTGLVRRVAAQNLDVRSAGFRLAQSRAQRGVTAASQFFQVNGNGSYTREKQSQRGVASLVGGSTSTESGSTNASTGGLAGGTTGGSVSGAPGSTANGLGGRQSGPAQRPGQQRWEWREWDQQPVRPVAVRLRCILGAGRLGPGAPFPGSRGRPARSVNRGPPRHAAVRDVGGGARLPAAPRDAGQLAHRAGNPANQPEPGAVRPCP